MYLGYLPRYTMHVHSLLPVCGTVLSWNVCPHPLPIYTAFNTQLKCHLIYEAFLGITRQINYGSFCTPSPTPLVFLSLKLISFYLTV